MRLMSARNQTMSLFMTKKDNTVGTNMTVLFEKDSSYMEKKDLLLSLGVWCICLLMID